MTRLAIFGASGHGKVVADAALASGWQQVAFFDDAWPGLSTVGPWAVIGGFQALLGGVASFDGAFVAIGRNRVRLERLQALTEREAAIPTIVHPSAVVSPFAEVGEGSVICAGAVVNPFARIGRACIVNTGASVDHDCRLGSGVHVSPGARLGGGVSVGEGSWVGIGASVRHGITIGAGVMVGAGAVVVSDVADGLTVVGVPARPRAC